MIIITYAIPSIMQWLSSVLQGTEKLWKVFWIGILIPFGFGFAVGIMKGILHLPGLTDMFRQPWWYLLQGVYFLGMAWLLWKCKNYSSIVWKILALIAVLLIVLGSISRLVPVRAENYNQACVKTLEDLAEKNGLDPKQYLAANRSYLDKCTKEYFRGVCMKNMQAAAIQNGVNLQTNDKSYLSQCIQMMEEKQAHDGADPTISSSGAP